MLPLERQIVETAAMHTVFPTGSTWVRRGLGVSIALHVVFAVVGLATFANRDSPVEVIDIELAPAPPRGEALPAEVIKAMEAAAAKLAETKPDENEASTKPGPDESGMIVDAGVDAAVDAGGVDAGTDAAPRRRPDAGVDAAPPDAGVDATELVAVADAGEAPVDDAVPQVAVVGDAGPDDAAAVAEGSGSGSGNGSGSGSGSDVVAVGSGSGSGSAGTSNEPAVEGAPTTAGTAANLLAYFPTGQISTALIRFDRLRGTEWAPTIERLFKPMPDYQVLFGTTDAKISDKLDTLVISSPEPRDPRATTLVAHVSMGRAALRDFLNAGNPVVWSAAKGGLLGRRTGKTVKGDQRVFLSPFRGWFVLGKPVDLPGLTAPATGNLDVIEATVKLPPWLAGIRKIEEESGTTKAGPTLVLTVALDGKKIDLEGNDFGLGIGSIQTPKRLSLAMEIVKQGWLVRGNISFAKDAEAIAFLASIDAVRTRILDSRTLQMVIGKPVVHLIENLSFARTGARLSYATSLSIADARALLAVGAQQLDSFFVGRPAP